MDLFSLNAWADLITVITGVYSIIAIVKSYKRDKEEKQNIVGRDITYNQQTNDYSIHYEQKIQQTSQTSSGVATDLGEALGIILLFISILLYGYLYWIFPIILTLLIGTKYINVLRGKASFYRSNAFIDLFLSVTSLLMLRIPKEVMTILSGFPALSVASLSKTASWFFYPFELFAGRIRDYFQNQSLPLEADLALIVRALFFLLAIWSVIRQLTRPSHKKEGILFVVLISIFLLLVLFFSNLDLFTDFVDSVSRFANDWKSS